RRTGGSKPYSGTDVLNLSAEKAAQGLCRDFRRGFREEMPAFDRISGHLVRPLPPQRERTFGVPGLERTVRAPQHKDGTADLAAGRKIRCPVLVLRSADGPLETWYPEGPLALWRQWADEVAGNAVEGGHFFPEAAPEITAKALRSFFSA